MANRSLALAGFLVLTVGGGMLIGLLNRPGEWHRALVKPSFNPPNWVFGPVWTTLYVMIGVAGWRIWCRSKDQSAEPAAPRTNASQAMMLWWLALVLNFSWSPTFFGAHNTKLALAIIGLLLAVIVGFIVRSWQRHTDRVSALLFIPYALWVSFATLLNGAIVRLNP